MGTKSNGVLIREGRERFYTLKIQKRKTTQRQRLELAAPNIGTLGVTNSSERQERIGP